MKLRYILIPMILVLFIYGYYDYKTQTQTQPTPQVQVNNNLKDLQKEIDTLQMQVNKYKVQEQDDQLRQIRLQQLIVLLLYFVFVNLHL